MGSLRGPKEKPPICLHNLWASSPIAGKTSERHDQDPFLLGTIRFLFQVLELSSLQIDTPFHFLEQKPKIGPF